MAFSVSMGRPRLKASHVLFSLGQFYGVSGVDAVGALQHPRRAEDGQM